MSAELIIIPVALAVVAFRAAQKTGSAAQSQGEGVYAWKVATAMVDRRLIQRTIDELEGEVTWRADDATLVMADSVMGLTFEGGQYAVLVDAGKTQEQAMAMALELEQAYMRTVQASVIERIQQHAPDAGLTIADIRRNQDRSVTLTLEVGAV